LSADDIHQRIFTRSDELPEGVERLPLKELHINKSPVVAPASTLTPDQAERWQLSGERLRQNLARIKSGPDLTAKLHQVFNQRVFDDSADVDGQLYSGFFSRADKQAMDAIHRLKPEGLAQYPNPFKDKRGDEMLFRYRARNYPDTLTEDEHERWEQFRLHRLMTEHNGTGALNFQQFAAALQQSAEAVMDQPGKLHLLEDLQLYAESIYPGY